MIDLVTLRDALAAHGRVARIVAANAFDEALWAGARARQCRDLGRLGLAGHPVVRLDQARARVPACPGA